MDLARLARIPQQWSSSLWEIFIAFLSDEHCRLCRRYIDRPGWLAKHATESDITRVAHSGTSRAVCADCFPLIEPERPFLTRYLLTDKGVLEFPKDAIVDTTETGDRILVVASGISYCEPMKKLIRRYKYDKDLLLTSDLSLLLMNGWDALSPFLDQRNVVLVPVPLHWKRKRERGYNQSALVAERAAKALGLKMSESAIRRCKATRPQNKLSKEAREENLAAAFKGNRKLIEGKDIVLVDDVCTSGATLGECAKEAYACGARFVSGLTIARAILVHRRETAMVRRPAMPALF
jgi:ComF family protein